MMLERRSRLHKIGDAYVDPSEVVAIYCNGGKGVSLLFVALKTGATINAGYGTQKDADEAAATVNGLEGRSIEAVDL
jgi:hypothetical protein